MTVIESLRNVGRIISMEELGGDRWPEHLRTVSAAAERIVELEASQRRAIKLVERLLPYVRWDGLDGEDEEQHARTTLAILREKVEAA